MLPLQVVQVARRFSPTNHHKTITSSAGCASKRLYPKPRKAKSGWPEQFCGEMPRNLQSLRVKEEENEVSEKLFPRVKMFEEIALKQGLSLSGTR